MGLMELHFYLCAGGNKYQVSFVGYNNLQFHRVDELERYHESTLIIEKKGTEDVSCLLKGYALGCMLQGVLHEIIEV